MMRFIYMCRAIAKAETAMRAKQRQIDLHDARLLELEERRKLQDARVAQAYNTLVLQDIEIEKKKLELEVLEKQVHPPKWQDDPTDPDESAPKF